MDLGKLIFLIFEEFVAEKLINPAIVDRFELYIGGREIANGFSRCFLSFLTEAVYTSFYYKFQVTEYEY